MIRRAQRAWGAAVYAVTGAGGLALMLYPLWRPVAPGATGSLYGPGAPLVLAALVGLCFVALAFEASAGGLGARTVAALGVLVAINSTLRLIEVAVPGPGGFTPVFLLIILAGYVFGSRFGLLMGALTMAVSALVTGGIGPWLPYQMLAAGWVGTTAGWLPGGGRGRAAPTRAELLMLVAFGAAWGFGYGLLMTPWTWQYVGGGGGPAAGWRGFLAFYAATSLVWDAFGAGGTALLIALAGGPVVATLRRLGRWFDFEREQGAEGRAPVRPRTADADAGGHEGLHPYAWLAWALSVALLASLTRNPLVLVGVCAAVATVALVGVPPAGRSVRTTRGTTRGTRRGPRRGPTPGPAPAPPPGPRLEPTRGPALVPLAAGVLGVAAAYNLLSAHHGQTVLARLPAAWPVVGGPLTAEALVYGLANGLSLVALIAVFVVLSRAVTTRSLLRLVPRAFGALALAGAIAVGYLPSVGRQLAEVREAQAVRGLRATGLRAWTALLLPLLAGSLERSVALAESLTSRGLGPPAPAPAAARAAVTGGLALMLAGWLAAVTSWAPQATAGALVGTGGLVAGGTLVALGRRARSTSYRPLPWRARDTLVAAAALSPLAIALQSPAARAALGYQPFPRLSVPMVDGPIALALAALVIPAAFARARTAGLVRDGGHAEVQGWEPSPWPVAARDSQTVWPDEPSPWPAAARDSQTVWPAEPSPWPAAARDSQTAWRAEASDTRSALGADRRDSDAAWRAEAFGFAYPGAARPALQDVSFALPRGGLTLVVGPSGVGKSTLLRTGNGLVPHFTGGAVRGALWVAGRDPVALGPGAMSDAVGFVAGDPERAFVMDIVADEVAFALEQRGVPRREMARRVSWALAQVELGGYADRPLATLSGGERQRVAVAAALALAPAVLVLDEPTSQIDDACAEGVLGAVLALARQRELSVVTSEHRIERVAPYAAGAIYLPRPAAPPVVGPAADVLPGVPRLRAPDAPANALGPAVVSWHDLRFAYDGREVLRGASLALHAGEMVALTGPSGAGKTTLLRLAVGLIRPSRGEVRVTGRSIAGRTVADVCRQVGFLPQDPGALLFAPTVRDELHVTLANHALDADDATVVAPLLAALGLADLADRYPRDLSTGERQRAALAAVAVTRPAALLLDEPTRGLDDAAIAALAGVLHGLCTAGAGVVVATHDRRLARAAHRTVRLHDGRVA